MLDDDQITEVAGREVYGPDGQKIGRVGRVFADDQTGQARWLSVETGLFGSHDTFVPAEGATLDGDRLTVPYAKGQVHDAPSLGAGDHLSPEDEETLDRYYRGQAGEGRDDVREGVDTDLGDTDPGDRDPDPGDDDAVTVSEEQLAVSTRSVPQERVRLRKHVVTEEITMTVTVRKERFTVEREPIPEDRAGDYTGGTDFGDSDAEIVLHEEVPVVQKVVRPVERIRLTKEVDTHEETVGDEVRKERVDVDNLPLEGTTGR